MWVGPAVARGRKRNSKSFTVGSAEDFEVTFQRREQEKKKSLIRAVCNGQQEPSAFRFLSLQIRRLRPKLIHLVAKFEVGDREE